MNEGNITPISTKRQPTQQGQPDQINPDALALAERTTEAAKQAMVTCGVMIATIEDRPMSGKDEGTLTRAGMAGWEVELFAMMRDDSISENIRGLALKTWHTKRAVIERAIRVMARGLCR